jgi:predicted nucleic acid-binding protein
VKIAIDTNILCYAEGVNGPALMTEALKLFRQLPTESIVIPAQALLELFNVLVRKAGFSRPAAVPKVTQWMSGYQTASTTSALMTTAMELAVRHEFQIFDAMILAAAAEAKCSLLLTEDMHEGFTWNGVTITNPFKPNRHVWLDLLLSGESQN